MNILVISNAAWDDTNSSGNTYSNLFGGWEDATFHSMYSREQLPSKSCCSSYYCVSPLNLIKNLLTPWKIGREFSQCEIKDQNTSFQTEQKAKSIEEGIIRSILLMMMEFLYLSGVWINKRSKNTIRRLLL